MRVQDTADQLDPEGQQDKFDCETDGMRLHPDFEHQDIDELNIQSERATFEKRFKPIEVDERSLLLEKIRQLDFYQRKVIKRGIQYARKVTKSLKLKNMFPEPQFPIVIVNKSQQ